MPLSLILVHLLFSITCLILVVHLQSRPWARRALVLLVAALWMIGFTVQRQPMWEQVAMRLPGSGWIFLTNLSLEVIVILLTALWCAAKDSKARLRAAILSPLVLGAAMASYAWYFLPPPAPLTGVVGADGTCPQTSNDSCSAAAAVTLLARHGIHATEAQMASLCLTRAGLGTTSLGIYRGLSLAAAPFGLRPRLIRIASLSDLRQAPYPCLISVGLKKDCPPAVRDRMISYGWEPGSHHSVVLLDPGSDGRRIGVSDPSEGHENWPLEDIDPIWNGYAYILVPR